MKFKRRVGLTGSHPDGACGIGIHALDCDNWMTIEEIYQNHKTYAHQFGEPCPTHGEIIRDLGLFICFKMVDIKYD